MLIFVIEIRNITTNSKQLNKQNYETWKIRSECKMEF